MGIVGIGEINFIYVTSTTACSIDRGFFVQVCSIGDRNSSALIQIKPCYTGLDIRNFYLKIVLTIKLVSINGILRRIGDSIGDVIGFNDYTIGSVISNALGQGIMKDNRVLIIVIVSTVSAVGQGSGQLELELFVDCMVSAGTKTSCAGAIRIVINFLLNSGLFGLRRNWNVPVSFGNHQQEGIVGMIGIVFGKVGSINEQIITCLGLGNGEGIATSSNDVCRVCIIRVEIVAYKTRESDAVIIGIMPSADNLKNILSSGSTFKLTADALSCLQLGQKILRISDDVAAPINVGNLKVFNIITLNITLEDLESAVSVM